MADKNEVKAVQVNPMVAMRTDLESKLAAATKKANQSMIAFYTGQIANIDKMLQEETAIIERDGALDKIREELAKLVVPTVDVQIGIGLVDDKRAWIVNDVESLGDETADKATVQFAFFCMVKGGVKAESARAALGLTAGQVSGWATTYGLSASTGKDLAAAIVRGDKSLSDWPRKGSK